MTHTHLTATTAFWKSPMAAELTGTRKTERLRNSNYLYQKRVILVLLLGEKILDECLSGVKGTDSISARVKPLKQHRKPQ